MRTSRKTVSSHGKTNLIHKPGAVANLNRRLEQILFDVMAR